jgi:hypothetical protein
MFHGHLDYFQKPSLGGWPNTKPGDHGILNAHKHWFILIYHVWGSAWVEIHWNSLWLRARSHMSSHYTWGYVTTLHDFGGVFGQPLDIFYWALTILWSRLLAHVWSGPKIGGLKWLLYLIGRLYLIGMWFGEDRRGEHMCFEIELDCVFRYE